MSAKKKTIYKVHGKHLNPLFKDTSLWECLRFIAYAFKSGETSVTLTKE